MSGALPSGRFSTSLDSFASTFAQVSGARMELWEEWQAATSLLQSHVPICAAWIGGSYLTTKDFPEDIDCVYILDSDHLETLPEESRRIVEAFASGKAIRQATGLRLDTFVLHWVSSATTQRTHPDVRQYHSDRGYWDDLWSKMRSGAKGADPTRLDSHPRRGYVEVILDGYSEEGPFRTN